MKFIFKNKIMYFFSRIFYIYLFIHLFMTKQPMMAGESLKSSLATFCSAELELPVLKVFTYGCHVFA